MHNQPCHILDLLKHTVRVRMETNSIVRTLPALTNGNEVQTLKLSPQEQEALALGLVYLNPPPMSLSE